MKVKPATEKSQINATVQVADGNFSFHVAVYLNRNDQKTQTIWFFCKRPHKLPKLGSFSSFQGVLVMISWTLNSLMSELHTE